MKPGLTYCFAVRARDRAGNTSAWSARRCVAASVDDRSLHRSNAWKLTSSSAYQRTLTVATVRGALLSRVVHGVSRVSVTALVCRDCGTLGIYDDGRLVSKVDLRASTTSIRTFSVGVTRRARSTVSWRVLSAGRRVAVDAAGWLATP